MSTDRSTEDCRSAWTNNKDIVLTYYPVQIHVLDLRCEELEKQLKNACFSIKNHGKTNEFHENVISTTNTYVKSHARSP
jgi:hypothetical protein